MVLLGFLGAFAQCADVASLRRLVHTRPSTDALPPWHFLEARVSRYLGIAFDSLRDACAPSNDRAQGARFLSFCRAPLELPKIPPLARDTGARACHGFLVFDLRLPNCLHMRPRSRSLATARRRTAEFKMFVLSAFKPRSTGNVLLCAVLLH